MASAKVRFINALNNNNNNNNNNALPLHPMVMECVLCGCEGMPRRLLSHQCSHWPATVGCTPSCCGSSSLLVLIHGPLTAKNRCVYLHFLECWAERLIIQLQQLEPV